MPITVRSRAALRWATSLVEPLLSTVQRAHLDNDFGEIARSESKWFAAFCAGVLSGITTSLPITDPWRATKANGVARWPDGRTFGLRADTDDVIRPIPEIDIPGIDPTTLALEQGISSSAAALLTISFSGWRVTYAALIKAQVQHGPDATFNTATSAIRWALHRRRAYRPEAFDAYLDFLVMGWAGWADDLSADTGLGDAVKQEIEDRARIERDALAQIAEDLEFFTKPD